MMGSGFRSPWYNNVIAWIAERTIEILVGGTALVIAGFVTGWWSILETEEYGLDFWQKMGLSYLFVVMYNLCTPQIAITVWFSVLRRKADRKVRSIRLGLATSVFSGFLLAAIGYLLHEQELDYWQWGMLWFVTVATVSLGTYVCDQ